MNISKAEAIRQITAKKGEMENCAEIWARAYVDKNKPEDRAMSLKFKFAKNAYDNCLAIVNCMSDDKPE